MNDFPPIWYVYCFDEIEEKESYNRLKISISSVPESFKINLISWHSNVEKKLQLDFPNRKIFVLPVIKKVFSKSFYINIICEYEDNKNNSYIYLSDIDLFFHPEYFYWLKFIMDKLLYLESDIRIITNNYNVRAIPRVRFLPDKLYGKLNFYFPRFFDWSLPTNINQILSRKLSKAGFAHGCGLIPINSLKLIGGYNSELIGHGPEDDLFNQRIKFYSRVYYHKGTFRSSTFHLPHPSLNQENRFKNHNYWQNSLNDIYLNGVYSDLIKR